VVDDDDDDDDDDDNEMDEEGHSQRGHRSSGNSDVGEGPAPLLIVEPKDEHATLAVGSASGPITRKASNEASNDSTDSYKAKLLKAALERQRKTIRKMTGILSLARPHTQRQSSESGPGAPMSDKVRNGAAPDATLYTSPVSLIVYVA